MLVYFQGGGACWNAETCDPEGDPTYSLDVDDSDNPQHHPFGIFDVDNARNPLREHSMVMVPYCTGDVHLGDRSATYTVDCDSQPSREVTVHHRGYANATAALEWVYAHFPEPAQIVVAGSSAGSIPSPFYAQLLADWYSEADIVALGDAAGSYRRDPASDANPILSWDLLDVVQRHPGYGDFDAASLGFADLYIIVGEQHPELRLLQFDAADDGVQQFFLDLAYEGESLVRHAIADNRAEIRARVASFRSYLAGGAEHTILGREAFYSYEVNGALFSDWLAAGLAGEPLTDVVCDSCERAEIHLTAEDASIAERALQTLAAEASWARRASEGRR